MATREETTSKLEKIFEALANPLRMKLYLQILKEGCDCTFDDNTETVDATCVKGLMVSLDMPQSTVSTYLRDLEECGLIECRKQGRNLYCRPSRGAVLDVKVFIDSALKQIRYR